MAIEVDVRYVEVESTEDGRWTYTAMTNARNMLATTDKNDTPIFVFVSLYRFNELINRFQSQHRFQPVGHLGAVDWEGSYLLPSLAVDDNHIAGMPMPRELKVLYR